MHGILLHQVIHWHNMGSAVLPPTSLEALKQNMVWDGLFHSAVGADAHWSVLAPDLVERLIDHHLLQLHHVRDLPTHVPLYDWLFLAIGGVGFILLGLALARGRGRRRESRPESVRLVTSSLSAGR